MKIIGEKLSNQEMLSVKGGASFCCYCGFVGGPGEDSPFDVTADNLNDALWGSGHVCQGQGATCSGGNCEEEQVIA